MLTPGGAAIVFSTLMVPFGLALLNQTLVKAVFHTGPGLTISWRVTVGCFLVLLPLITALVVTTARTLISNEAGLRKRVSSAFGETMSLVSKSSDATVSAITSGQRDQTTVEFEEYFDGLMEEILPETETKRQVIIVVDNLDRLEASTRQREVWQTLQVFIGQRDQPPPWRARTWVIVPIAREAAQTDELEKSIQLRVNVPHPVLTDWRALLSLRLRQALPLHNQADFASVLNVCSLRWGAYRTALTPRKITLFVNRLVLLHQEYAHVEPPETPIPLAVLALALLAEDDKADQKTNEGLVEALLSNEVPTDAERAYFGGLSETVVDQLAAIAFVATPERGRQLLFTRLIEPALGEKNLTQLVRTRESSEHGFDAVFEAIFPALVGRWALNDSVRVAAAAPLLLQLSHSFAQSDGARLEIVTRSLEVLANSARRVHQWPLDRDVVAGLLVLLREQPRSDLALSILNAIDRAAQGRAWNHQYPALEADSIFLRGYIDIAKSVVDAGLVDMQAPALTLSPTIEGMANGQDAFIAQFPESGVRTRTSFPQWGWFQCGRSVEEREALTADVAKVAEQSISPIHVAAVRGLVCMHPDASVSSLLDSLFGRFEHIASRGATTEALEPARLLALALAHEVRKGGAQFSSYQIRLAQGSVAHVLANALTQRLENLQAILAIVLYAEASAEHRQVGFGNARQAYAQLDKWALKPPAGLADRIVSICNELPVYDLIKPVVDSSGSSSPLWNDVRLGVTG